MIDQHSVPISGPTINASQLKDIPPDIAAHTEESKGPRPGELKWRLTMLIFPSILLLFVALYVTSLSSGIEPEVALLRAGGASLVLAVLARAAVGIIGDESRLVLSDRQIAAMARDPGIRDQLASVGEEHGPDHASTGTEQPSTAAQAAGTGGKE